MRVLRRDIGVDCAYVPGRLLVLHPRLSRDAAVIHATMACRDVCLEVVEQWVDQVYPPIDRDASRTEQLWALALIVVFAVLAVALYIPTRPLADDDPWTWWGHRVGIPCTGTADLRTCHVHGREMRVAAYRQKAGRVFEIQDRSAPGGVVLNVYNSPADRAGACGPCPDATVGDQWIAWGKGPVYQIVLTQLKGSHVSAASGSST